MTVPMIMPNSAAAMVGLEVGAQAGVHSPVSACATSAEAIAGGLEMIRNNRADIVVAGGTEACVNRLAIAAFASMRALSTRNNDPEKASRPYDTNRDGFVMAEGAGTLILEEEQHAIKRGAKIYAEVVGYGLSGDAYHMTAPESSGRGSTYAMKLALQHAKINPDQIDYINAHGTSTPLGDEIEIGAIKKVFGDHAYKLSLSSTKSAIGHLLGAAGAVEAIFSIQAIRDNIAPPTLNLEDPSEGCDIDLVANKAKERKIDIVMSNSFGFGGTNGCLILKRF
jgi:3-oxoacyl-[acyl-carrier-protein] synthase II